MHFVEFLHTEMLQGITIQAYRWQAPANFTIGKQGAMASVLSIESTWFVQNIACPVYHVNSVLPERYGSNFKCVIL